MEIHCCGCVCVPFMCCFLVSAFWSALACQLKPSCVSVCLTQAPICLQLAFQRGMLTEDERDRVFNVMTALGLRLWDDVCTVPVLMKVTSQDAWFLYSPWPGAV